MGQSRPVSANCETPGQTPFAAARPTRITTYSRPVPDSLLDGFLDGDQSARSLCSPASVRRHRRVAVGVGPSARWNSAESTSTQLCSTKPSAWSLNRSPIGTPSSSADAPGLSLSVLRTVISASSTGDDVRRPVWPVTASDRRHALRRSRRRTRRCSRSLRPPQMPWCVSMPSARHGRGPGSRHTRPSPRGRPARRRAGENVSVSMPRHVVVPGATAPPVTAPAWGAPRAPGRSRPDVPVGAVPVEHDQLGDREVEDRRGKRLVEVAQDLVAD